MKEIYIAFNLEDNKVNKELYSRFKEIGKTYDYQVIMYKANQDSNRIPDAYISQIFPIPNFYPDSMIEGFFWKTVENEV